jgi:hypothetical protein
MGSPQKILPQVRKELEVSGPSWLNDFFAGIMLVVAAFSVGRLIVARVWSRPTHVDVDVAHVLMGVAMAGMFDSAINPVPSGVWETAFAGLSLWFVWRCYQFVIDPGTETQYDDHVHRLSRRLIHLVMSLAMVYAYSAAATPEGASTSGGMAMSGATGTTADFVGIPLLFLVALLVSAIWELDGIGRFSPAQTRRPQPSPVLVPTGSAIRRSDAPEPAELLSGASIDGNVAETVLLRPWLAPRLEAGAHIAMTITMGYMLVLLL